LLFPSHGILAIQAALRNNFILEKYPVLLQAFLHPQSQKENKMKRFMLATALACALSATVIAGEIPSTGAPAPPPPASNSLVVTAILTIISIVV
jgi:hypothetical protein